MNNINNNFNINNDLIVENNTPVLFTKKIKKTVNKPLTYIINDTGKTRHFTPAAQEWFNSIYAYDHNYIRSLPIADKNLLSLLKSYFNMQIKPKGKRAIRKAKKANKKRRLLTKKVFIGKGDIKHTSNKVTITFYVHNTEKMFLSANIRKLVKKLYRPKKYPSLYKVRAKDKEGKYIKDENGKYKLVWNRVFSAMEYMKKLPILNYIEKSYSIDEHIPRLNKDYSLIIKKLKKTELTEVEKLQKFNNKVEKVTKNFDLFKKNKFIRPIEEFIPILNRYYSLKINMLKTIEVSDVENLKKLNEEVENIISTFKRFDVQWYLKEKTQNQKEISLVCNKISEVLPRKNLSRKDLCLNSLDNDKYGYMNKLNINNISNIIKIVKNKLNGNLNKYKNEVKNIIMNRFDWNSIYTNLYKKIHKDLLRNIYLLMFNKTKFTQIFMSKLTHLVKNIYNKEVVFNIVNLKKMHLSSDIYTQIVALKLKNRKNKLYRVLKASLRKVKVPTINRKLERARKKPTKNEVFLNKIRNRLINSMFTEDDVKDPLNNLLLNYFPSADNLKVIVVRKRSIREYPVSLKNYVLMYLKHIKVRGVRVEAKGRLTRRFTASRSVFKMKWKGGLKNIESSFRGLSAIMLRGYVKSNAQYTVINSKNRNGAFGVKGWVSSK
jgi:hypothetical protein